MARVARQRLSVRVVESRRLLDLRLILLCMGTIAHTLYAVHCHRDVPA